MWIKWIKWIKNHFKILSNKSTDTRLYDVIAGQLIEHRYSQF